MTPTRSTFVLAAALAGALLSSAPTASAAPVLYDQPFVLANAWLSEDISGQSTVWRTFDNFTLPAAGTINRISFVGGYVDLSNTDYPPPDSTDFTFRFFADDAGRPASAAQSEQTVAFGDVTSAYMGTVLAGGFKTSVYSFSADLPAGFAANGLVPYWLSISSVAPAGSVQWAWFSGSGGDDSTLQVQNGTIDIWRGRDRAFTLETVPEPATMLMFTAGVVGMVGHRRLRRRVR